MGGSPSPPSPPDPKETIAAQSAADREAIAAQAQYNRINEVTPTGSLTYTGTPGGTDYTRNTNLTADQQRLLDLQEQIGITGYELADQQLNKVTDVLEQGFPAQDLPEIRQIDEAGLPGRIAGAQADDIQGMQRQVQDQAYNEFLRRNNEDFTVGRDKQRQSLADRGIAEGSELYNRELSRTERDINDAKQGAAYGAFELGQNYGLQQSNYTNAQRDAGLSEQLNLQQREQDLRNTNLQEQKFLRDVPLSDISTLMGYSAGPSTPGVSSLTPINVPRLDAAGIINDNYQNQIAAYNARLQSKGGGIGGIFGNLLGAAGQIGAAYVSDARIKHDILALGKLGQHDLFMFSYLGSAKRYIGVMAQLVQKIVPQAIHNIGGILMVDYAMIGMPFYEVSDGQ